MREESQELDAPTVDTPTAALSLGTGSASTTGGLTHLRSEPLPFPAWDRYSLVTVLGAGGMGTVYRAHDPRLHRFVALKLLRDANPSSDLAQRFYREARAQARIDHEHLCKIYEVGEVDGRPYIAMQCIEGQTLSAARNQMTLPQKILCIKQVAEAVHAAHREGLIHRGSVRYQKPSRYRDLNGCVQTLGKLGQIAALAPFVDGGEERSAFRGAHCAQQRKHRFCARWGGAGF